jgi:hypothetical protein
MGMAESAEAGTEHEARSAEVSIHRAAPPSTAESAPAGVGKGAIIAGIIALLIGVLFGFTMSTVGLR